MHYVSWLVLATLPAVLAQSENANCTDLPTYLWVYNKKGQSPCVVVESLAKTCDANPFQLLPITSNGSYSGPTVAQSAKGCYCSSIFYSLISACAACQYGTWITWTHYHRNCSSNIYSTGYPDPIPSDTAVPRWAYLDVTATNDTFDPSRAATVAASGSGSKLSTRGIAGAVVGSVLGALLIAALLYALYRWRKKRGTVNADAGNTGQMSQPTRSSPTASSPPLSSPGTSPPFSEHQPLKYYNPDDPTTHPNAIFGQIGSPPDQPQGYAGYAEPS